MATTPRRGATLRLRGHTARLGAMALIAAGVLAGCGAAASTSSTSTSLPSTPTTATNAGATPSAGSTPQSFAAANLPDPCSLVTAAEASAALQVPLRETQDQSSADSRSCDWVDTTSSLGAGLGSSMNLYIYPGPTVSQRRYYQTLESQAAFVPTEIDGYRAVVNGAEYEVDLGSILLSGDAISTVSQQVATGAERTLIGSAIGRACEVVRCER